MPLDVSATPTALKTRERQNTRARNRFRIGLAYSFVFTQQLCQFKPKIRALSAGPNAAHNHWPKQFWPKTTRGIDWFACLAGKCKCNSSIGMKFLKARNMK